ncbi:MAG: hypothetical protein NWS75_04600 [Solirubrobacteraceae bacterium]|nr:hypothetical protein [Solirubrobacteraceae bacterium]
MNPEETINPGAAEQPGQALRDPEQPSEPATTWSDRFVGVAMLLVALCFPAIWVYSGYKGFSFNASLSFFVDDGWCVKGVESFASHCFGDYAVIDDALAAGELWGPSPLASIYPAIAWLPTILALRVGELVGDPTVGRNLFLALLACSLLTPAIWAARGSFSRRAPVTFLLIGLASAPFLIVLDRGNSIGLLVAPLLGLAISYATGNFRRMMIFIVICSLLKPQMILLVVLFLVFKKYGYLLATVAIAVAATLAGFATFPSSFPQNIEGWLTKATKYSGYQTVDALYPYNLGLGRALLTISDFLQIRAILGEPARADLVVWLQANNSLLVIALLLLVVSAIMLRKQGSNLIFPLVAILSIAVMTPGVAYGYYVALFLVPAAMILRDPNDDLAKPSNRDRWAGMLDRPGSSGRRAGPVAKWVLIAGLALLLAPLVIALPSFTGLSTNAPSQSILIGLVQVLYGPILLLLLLVSAALTVGRIERGTLRERLRGSAGVSAFGRQA